MFIVIVLLIFRSLFSFFELNDSWPQDIKHDFCYFLLLFVLYQASCTCFLLNRYYSLKRQAASALLKIKIQ